ncbi:putative nuclease HARBI1 [Tanacetum coccineum]
MNPYFAMNPNDKDEERQPNSFDVDDESDVYFLQQAYKYHKRLVEEENHPILTRNSIHRDREGAKERLMGGYFNDHFAICQLEYDNTHDAFDEYLQMSGRTAHDSLIVCTENGEIVQYHSSAGANNDINVLDNSPLFDDLFDDKALVAPFVVNGVGFYGRKVIGRFDGGVLERLNVLLGVIGEFQEVFHIRRRREEERINHLKQDQGMLVIKICVKERKEEERKMDLRKFMARGFVFRWGGPVFIGDENMTVAGDGPGESRFCSSEQAGSLAEGIGVASSTESISSF